MTSAEDELIARLVATGDRLDVPDIDLEEVAGRAASRRRHRGVSALAGVAALVLLTFAGVHFLSGAASRGGTGARSVAPRAMVASSSTAVLGAGPACGGPDSALLPLLTSRPRTVSAGHPLTFTETDIDTPDARFLDGALYLGKKSLALDARLPDGSPAVTLVANQVAHGDSRLVSSGRWVATLRVTALPAGSYPLVSFTHYRYSSADCIARGGTEVHSGLAFIGEVEVR